MPPTVESAAATAELEQELRRGEGPVLVVSGAGISLASGIPTFRGSDPDAVWQRDLTELATRRYFLEDPVGSWQWYLQRFECTRAARPNAAHQALVEIEGWLEERRRAFVLITQNVDTLHEQAGQRQLIKVHGSADRVRCSVDGCRDGAPRGSVPRAEVDFSDFLAAPGERTLPRCSRCDAVLRPHVLWFDELYDEHASYEWQRAQRVMQEAALTLFVGTSFSVGVTDVALRSALACGSAPFSIDPTPVRGLGRLVRQITAAAEDSLPELARRLAAT